MDIKDFSDISSYYNGKNTFGWTNTLARSAAFPIEKFSVFGSLNDAQKYVNGEQIEGMGSTAGLAYAGQIIVVSTADKAVAYIVDPTFTSDSLSGLRELASGGAAEDILDKLNSEISTRATADKYLSNEISTLTTTTLPDLSAYLENELVVSLSTVTGLSSTAYLKKYILMQNGENKGEIDIPKDFLVKSASVSTVTEEDKAEGGKFHDNPEFEVGDKYLDFVINTKDESTKPADEHIYVNLKTLVDIYTGGETQTISVTVGSDNVISANIREGHIYRDLLSADVTGELDALRTDVNTMSIDLSGALDEETGILAKAKTYTDEVSSALSTDYSDKIYQLENEFIDAADYLSDEIDHKVFIKDPSSTEYADGKFTNLSVVKITEDDFISCISSDIPLSDNVLYVLSSDHLNAFGQKLVNLAEPETSSDAATKNYVDATKNYIDVEILNLSNDVNQTNQNIDKKIWIKDPASEEYADGKNSDLSVIKITEEEYMAKVADGTLLSSNVLYVISADNINAYGQKLVNLAEPDISSDAATKNYVDSQITELSTSSLSGVRLNDVDFIVNNNVAELIISCINCGGAIEQ